MAGGRQSDLVQRERVLKSHRLNAFNSQYVHQCILEQDIKVLPCSVYSLTCNAFLLSILWLCIQCNLCCIFLTIKFIDTVNCGCYIGFYVVSPQPQVRLWSRCLSRVWVRSRPSESPVKKPPGWDPKRAPYASTDRRWRPRWRPTRWRRWNPLGPNRWGTVTN